MSSLDTWKRKREMLQGELAKATGEQKFAIQEALDEADAMITKLEGADPITRAVGGRSWIAGLGVAGVLLVGLIVFISTGGGGGTAPDASAVSATDNATSPSSTSSTSTSSTSTSSTSTSSTSTPSSTSSTTSTSTTSTTTTTIPELTGTLNVAVAAFRAEPEDDESAVLEARNSATELVEFIGGRLKEVGVDVGLFPGPDFDDDGPLLDRLATERGVDLVVFATLRTESGEAGQSVSFFDLEFAIRPGSFPGDGRFVGTFQLGDEAPLPGSYDQVAVRVALRTTLQRRSCILVHLLNGVSRYQSGSYEAARGHFERAATAESCVASELEDGVASDGETIARQFLGNIHLLQGDLDSADAAYDAVLAIDDDSIRALFGKAEVAFQRARVDCIAPPTVTPGEPPGVESLLAARQSLDSAFAAFRDSASRQASTPSYVQAQGYLQRGRIELCLAEAQPVDLPVDGATAGPAAEAFFQVVELYAALPSSEQRRIADLAAEAFAGLGIVAQRSGDLEAARMHFTQAIDVNPGLDRNGRDRRSLFLSYRAGVLTQLGRQGDADRDCARVEAAVESNGPPCPPADDQQFFEPLPNTGRSSNAITVTAGLVLAAGLALIAVSRRRESEQPSQPAG